MKSRVALSLSALALVSCGSGDPSVGESLMVVNISQYLEVFNPGGPSRIVATLPGTVAIRLSQLSAVGANFRDPLCAGYLPGRSPAPGSPDSSGFVGYALIVHLPNPQHRAAAQRLGFEPLSISTQQALSPPRSCAELGLS
jgi:hypothetical protein